MLTNAQKSMITSTVPLLQQLGSDFGKHFYARMFHHDPEVLAYFNPAHQRSGAQQNALTQAVLAYAQHISGLEPLEGAVAMIAHKHVSLTIQPEHYPIVGHHLLETIRELLGAVVDDAMCAAWAAAYQQLADILITRENGMYHAQQMRYGWSGFKPFNVIARHDEGHDIVSFHLQPADGVPLVPQAPGQYVTVRATVADGKRVMRQYSLSNAPGASTYRISVKREQAAQPGTPDGVLSNYLHTALHKGDTLELTPPCGTFTLPDTFDHAPLVFIAGGVGITPLISMAHAALKQQHTRQIVFIHALRPGSRRPFADELSKLVRHHPGMSVHVCDSGREASARLQDWIAHHDTHYYFCGAQGFMQHIDGALAEQGVETSRRHYENFGPHQGLS